MSTDRIEYPVNSGFIQIVAAGHMLPAFWAHPDTGGTYPGIALLHDHWGLTAQTRHTVHRLAQAGYYVIAPSLFDGQQAETPAHAAQLADHLGEAGPPYAAAAIGALQTHNHCNGDVAVLGFGMGGTLAYHMAAHRDDIKAVITLNGQSARYKLLLATDDTPLLEFFGGQAGILDEAALAQRQQQAAAQPDRTIIIYPQVGRHFTDETQPDYDATAADDAWKKFMNFLGRTLDRPSHAPGIHHKTY